MAKYMLHWQVDTTRTPNDPKERKQQWRMLQDMIAKQLKDGLLKDWGEYLGELNGYCIIEGTKKEVMNFLVIYSPFIIFKVNEVISVQDAIATAETMPG